jgi:RNA-splicing ligase RtcB
VEKDGRPEDIDTAKKKGCMDGANPDKVATKAKQRGLAQCGNTGF